MTLSAKWTTVSFFALTALGAGSFMFAGCTVTSGDPDKSEAGTGNPPVDGGGGTDTSTTPAACADNTQKTKFLPVACQAALEQECCTELKDCFNATGVTSTNDCNVFASCVDDCRAAKDGGTPTEAEANKCITDFCVANSPAAIVTAYNKIVDCQELPAHTKAVAACK